MSEIQKGDASLRRVTIAIVVAGAIVGAALIALATVYRPAFEDWLKEDLRARARLVMGALAVATAGPVLGLSGYMWIFGRRIIRAERYPPPGLRVTHDTPVVIGDVARRRGRLLQVFAGALAIMAAALAGLLLRVVAWQAAAAARKAPSVEPAVRADIERLMDITGQSAMAAQLATTISDALLNNLKNSQKNVLPRAIEIARDVLNTEFANAFAGSDIKDKQIALYAKSYTHADIKGLLAFYETDLGRKMIANSPTLMREGAAIGEDWAKATMPGLMQKMQARFKAEGLIP